MFIFVRQLLLGAVCLSSLTITSASFGAEPKPKPKQELIIAAAASLQEVFEEISPVFEQKNQSIKLVFQFASSGSLQQQIEQGAPIDVFVSAAQKQVDALVQKDLVHKDSVQTVLSNSLVLIVPKGKKSPQKLEDLKMADFKRIAIGEVKTVPAGQYAEQWLERNNLLAAVKDRLIPSSNVRQVLTYVETGNVDAGFVYKTDALDSTGVTISFQADSNQHDPIVYPLALVKKSTKVDAGKTFSAFLKSDAARSIFTKRGFVVPAEKAI